MMLGFTLLGSHFIQTKNVTQTGHELKLTTGFTAEACMEMALEKIGLDNDYAGNEVLNVDGFTCRIRPVYKLDNQWIMEVEAQNGSNFYRYRVKLSNLDPMTVSSWLEVPQF